MIDVVVGKPFKDSLCNYWAEWMLETCESLGVTPAGNFRHPTPTNCNTWVTKAWKNLKMDGVLKKAAELGMTPAPGPEVAGYEDKDFADVLPQGPEEEVVDGELWKDFMPQVEAEL